MEKKHCVFLQPPSFLLFVQSGGLQVAHSNISKLLEVPCYFILAQSKQTESYSTGSNISRLCIEHECKYWTQ